MKINLQGRQRVAAMPLVRPEMATLIAKPLALLISSVILQKHSKLEYKLPTSLLQCLHDRHDMHYA